MNWACFASTLGILMAALVVMVVVRKRLYRWQQHQRARRAERGVSTCANCGYSLKELDIPRCPECGALRGFKKPLTALGLTEEEIREGFARRRRERELLQDNSESQP